MNRIPVLIATVCLLLLEAASGWAVAPAEKEEDAGGRYAIPEGGIDELMWFIGSISQFKPTSYEEDTRHRARFRPALRQAAERILKLESDPATEAHQRAVYILLADRVYHLAQADPQSQRRTVADVQAYLKEKLKEGESKIAVELAMTTGQNLRRAGLYESAAAAYKTFAEVAAASRNQKLSDRARQMEATARRLLATSKAFKRVGPEIRIPPLGKLVPLDLTPMANVSIDLLSGAGPSDGNGFPELAKGEQTFGGMTFNIGPGLIQLGSTRLTGMPPKAEEIPVGRTVSLLYFLHGTQWSPSRNPPDGTLIGQYQMHYEDGSAVSVPIVYGQDVRDWWDNDQGRPVTRGKVVWTGRNSAADKSQATIRLYLGAWENPHPERKVISFDYISTAKTGCAPFLLAVTVEEPPTSAPP